MRYMRETWTSGVRMTIAMTSSTADVISSSTSRSSLGTAELKVRIAMMFGDPLPGKGERDDL